jgi:hypothetical protein
MKSIKLSTAGAAVVLLVLLAVAYAYAAAQGSTANRAEATEVEAALAHTNLAHRLEVALGGEFGGIWFEPRTAQVHVGVTSAASRRGAEALAARAGLAESVTETPVGATWDQLESAQHRWNRRLEDLFERGEVTTALSAERNSVEVELASSVPSARRAALRREAAADGIGVILTVASKAHLDLEPMTRCATFKAGAANCEPPIVAGVSIDGAKGAVAAEEFEEEEGKEFLEDEPEYNEYEQGKKQARCTASPPAILRNPANAAEATQIYLLTAGHCINEKKGGGGVGKAWAAYDKGGKEHEIGPAATYLDERWDIGVIEVNTTFWAKAHSPTPVSPTIAAWNKTAASDPFPVILQITPVEKTNTCMSGQISAIVCGTIIDTNKTIKSKVKGAPKFEKLVEVQGVTTQKGDSGAPWFAEAEYTAATPTGYVEGVHAGRNTGNGNALFQPLDVGFAELDNQKGYDLELLTRTNERRVSGFVSTAYPFTASAKNTSAEDVFTTAALKGKCTEDSVDGEVTDPGVGEEVNAIKLTPTYGKCVQTGSELKFDVEFGSEAKPCYYLFTAGVGEPEGSTGDTEASHAPVHLKCAEGEKVKVKLTLGGVKFNCIEIPPQTLNGVHYTNVEGGGGKTDIEISGTIEGFEYTEKGTCGSETRKDGTMHGQILLAGTSGEKSVSISYDEP